MGLNEVKKELNRLSKEKLIKLIADLYKKNKSVKEYLDFYSNPDEKEQIKKYRDKVFEAFYPTRGSKLDLRKGKQTISDFKKLGTSQELLAELMLFFVETGVAYTNDFGDINENFYVSLEKTFVQALTLLEKENILDKFAERANKVEEESYGIGWGFYDYISEVFYDFYPDYLIELEEDTNIEKGKIIKLKKNIK